MSEYCQTRCTACEAFLWGKATGAPRSHVTRLSHVTLLRGWSNFLRGLFTQDKPRCLASGLVGEPVVPSVSPICTFCRHWSPAVEKKYASQTWRIDPTPQPCLIFAQSGCPSFSYRSNISSDMSYGQLIILGQAQTVSLQSPLCCSDRT